MPYYHCYSCYVFYTENSSHSQNSCSQCGFNCGPLFIALTQTGLKCNERFSHSNSVFTFHISHILTYTLFSKL